MPTGIYIRTEECNQAHRVKRLGSGIYQRTPEQIQHLITIGYKKGDYSRNQFIKGHIVSKEIRRKISLANIGKHQPSLETKIKLSKANKGNKNACKFGATILTPEYKREWCRAYYQKNLEKMRQKSKANRHNYRGAKGKLTIKILQLVYEDNIKNMKH